MARIGTETAASVLKISRFLGLNENPDGDTAIKVGELSEMRNFRITKGNHLQKRPGTKTVLDLHTLALALDNTTYTGTEQRRLWGAWRGSVGGKAHMLAVYGGYIWDVDPAAGTATAKGTAAAAEATFFGFGGKVYLLNGVEYKSWDGGAATGFSDVTGYIPLVQTATSPAGAGTLVEEVNRLNGMRRVEFSPDGTSKTFQLPEKSISEVTEVKLNGAVVTNGYTVSTAGGTVTMTSAPASGVNTLSITYRKGNGARSEVTGMRFAELYNGSADTRVFLYGDGSNKAIYSGVDLDTGQASAEYFPDLYEVAVGESNTPITALVRHHARLMAFKSDSAWAIQAGTVTLVSGAQVPAFYVSTVNRQFGNDAPGQVKLLENDPLTLDAGGIYHWQINNYSGGNENNAKRISERVTDSLESFDFKRVRTANIKSDQEYWVLGNGRALVLNYAVDAWYRYDGLPFSELLDAEEEKYGFCEDGRVVRMSREYRSDDGEEINCYAATGSMDFGKGWLLKYSPVLFISMKPEQDASIYVSVETNRRSDYPKKNVVYSFSTFLRVDFNHFSFGTNRKPQVKKVKMKVKKAAYYRLIFSSKSNRATATIIETDIQLRYSGNVR